MPQLKISQFPFKFLPNGKERKVTVEKDNQSKEVAFEKPTISTLKEIVQELRMDNNKLALKYDLKWDELKYCNIDFVANGVVLKVEHRKGGFSTTREDPRNLRAEIEKAEKIFNLLEKAVRKEYKERTGKSLKLKKGKGFSDHSVVSVNGIYRFSFGKRFEF